MKVRLFAVAALFIGVWSLAGAQEPLRVIATYSILGDLVQNVGGDAIALTVLVGADSDSHTYEPSPQDAIRLSEADLIFENGLEFESWLDDLYTASGAAGTRVVVSEGIEPLTFEEEAHMHGDEASAEDHEHEEAVAMLRLAVNDYESGTVHVINLSSNEVAATYELSSRASLYNSHSGRYAYAVQAGGDVVNVIDSGISQVLHDDHYDTQIADPSLLEFAVEGQTPIHFVVWDDQVTIFNDGDGSVAIFNESGITDGSAEVTTFTTERPHHGVGAAVGDYVLLSIPNMADADDSLPIGMEVRNLAGEEIARFEDCPDLHGEAHAGENGIAFACSDGILIVSWDGGEFTGTKLAYPEGSGELRAGTLRAAHDGQYVIGNFGDAGLIRVDYAAQTLEQLELPTNHWRFEVFEEDPSKLLVLTMDGSIHLVDIASGTIEGSVEVVEAFARPTRAAARPTFAQNGHLAYVSEPLPGDIAIVNMETFEVAEDRIVVGGKPSALTAFGVMGEDHHADEAAHEGEGDAHEHGEFDPHIWHSVDNAILMVANIRDALIAADPTNEALYTANAAAYTAELTALQAEITVQIETIPAEQRILFTSHDTFGYLGRDYGFTVDSALESFSTETADPSAADIAEIITEIQASGVSAIFAENIATTDLMQQIADNAGVALAPTLYTDALGAADSPASTYLDMMRYNISTIVSNLTQ